MAAKIIQKNFKIPRNEDKLSKASQIFPLPYQTKLQYACVQHHSSKNNIG